MTTAACLYHELVDDADDNRERLLAGIEGALDAADVVVGPETATAGIGHDPDDIRALAEPIDGETVTRAREIVDRAGGIAAFGLPERSAAGVANACVLLESGREPRVYRQPEHPHTHAWTDRYGEYLTLETAVGTVVPVVCGDLVFPGTREYLAGCGADLAVAPANWGEDDRHRPLLERWRGWSSELPFPLAVGNAYAPAWRSDRGFAFDGPSAILADGAVLAWTDEPGETVAATL